MLAACLCLPGLFAQSSAMLTVEPPAKLVARRGTVAEVRIPVALKPGYHVNSDKPSDEYLIPLSLKWQAGPLEPAGVVYPKPVMEKYPFADKPLSVFTGNFNLVAKFKVPEKTPVGPGMMSGKLRYQACNDKACFPPKTVEVTLPYSVQ